MIQLGTARGVHGEHQVALAGFLHAQGIIRERSERSPDDPDQIRALGNVTAKVGAAQNRSGDFETAISTYEEALEILGPLVDDWPHDVSYRGSLARAHSALSEVLIHAGDLEWATDCALEGLEVIEPLCEADPDDMFGARWSGLLWFNLAWSYLERSQLASNEDERQSLLREALEGFLQSEGIFETMSRRGALMGRESGFLSTIRSRIATVRRQLEESEPRPGR